MMDREWIKNLPKIDLHCHLDGSMDIETVRNLLENDQKTFEDDKLRETLQVSENCKGLTEYLEKFEIPLRCLQTEHGLKLATINLLKQAADENVQYIEIRFAPMLSVHPGLSAKKVIESVAEGLKEGESKYSVRGGIIVCAMRHHEVEKNIEMLKVARELLGYGVCALDLAGDESVFPTSLQRELFYKAQKWEMPFTIHSGECGSTKNIEEAMRLGARRLGHGIALQKSEALMEECRQKRIGVEMCPSSNKQTKAVSSLKDYPLALFLEKGLLATINTDNRTVSRTSMTDELMIASHMLQDNKESIVLLLKNAIEVSFAKEEVKEELRRKLNNFL